MRSTSTRQPAKRRRFRVPGAGRIRGRELPLFCRSLAAMLNTGMPLGTCLRCLESQADNRHLRATIVWLRMDVESGVSPADSISQFPSLFDGASAGMIRAAEMTGRLPEAFEQIAGLLETAHRLHGRIRAALVYPLIVMGLAVLLGWFLVAFVAPAFAGLYESLGNALPAPTQALLDTARFLRRQGIPVAVAVALSAFALGMIGRTARGRLALDRIILAAPVAGPLLQKASLARFARTYAALIRGGIATPMALETAAEAAGNRAMADRIGKARPAMEAGAPLSAALAGKRLIPAMFIEMIRTGEKTGRMDDLLDSLAEFYE